MWNKILNWKLLAGSHKFPGPDGGTCINEAAIIAAGYEYKAVSSANDCPLCFSRVISAYALRLNDRMPNNLRQELLLPFVTRLAGTADPAKEIERVRFISLATINRVLPICLRNIGLEKQALACETAQDLNAACAAAYAAYAAAYAAARAAYAAAYAADAAARAAAYADARASAYAAVSAAYAADAADATSKQIFEIAVAILAETIEMGNHSSEPEIVLIQQRMEAAKRLATVS